MKWRRTIIFWFLLFIPLSIYNVFGSPLFFPTESTQYQDLKTQSYNFSMASPIYVTGNFSASFPLGRPQTYYRLSAHVDVSADYESYGAYGAFPLWASVAENGIYHAPNNERIDFVLPPPVPPSGYGSAIGGYIPDNTAGEEFNHLIEGTSTILLNFTFRFIGIGTQPLNYGPGYFKLNIGPLRVIVIDLAVVYSLGAASELILAVLLFPVANASNILLLKLRRKRSTN